MHSHLHLAAPMYVRMRIYMYACMYVYINACMYACMYVCMCIGVRMHACMYYVQYACINAHISIYVHAYIGNCHDNHDLTAYDETCISYYPTVIAHITY